MFKTPSYTHLTKKDLENVYEPAEDTFLFLDALESEIEFFNELRPLVAIEVGSGAGLVITFLAKYLKRNKQTQFYAVDINPHACIATKKTAVENNVQIEVINCDLVYTIGDRLNNICDIILFNAPYVVTDSDEIGKGLLDKAWAGGVKGREVMDRLFPLVDKLLSNKGAFYLVCIKQNDINQIEQEMMSKYSMKMKIILTRKTLIETLFVLKFFK